MNGGGFRNDRQPPFPCRPRFACLTGHSPPPLPGKPPLGTPLLLRLAFPRGNGSTRPALSPFTAKGLSPFHSISRARLTGIAPVSPLCFPEETPLLCHQASALFPRISFAFPELPCFPNAPPISGFSPPRNAHGRPKTGRPPVLPLPPPDQRSARETKSGSSGCGQASHPVTPPVRFPDRLSDTYRHSASRPPHRLAPFALPAVSPGKHPVSSCTDTRP